MKPFGIYCSYQGVSFLACSLSYLSRPTGFQQHQTAWFLPPHPSIPPQPNVILYCKDVTDNTQKLAKEEIRQETKVVSLVEFTAVNSPVGFRRPQMPGVRGPHHTVLLCWLTNWLKDGQAVSSTRGGSGSATSTAG